LNRDQSAGNILKNLRENALKISRLLISATRKIYF
jgi:hypothetical protein